MDWRLDEDIRDIIISKAKRLDIDIEEYFNYLLVTGLYYNDCVEEDNSEERLFYYVKGLKGESI